MHGARNLEQWTFTDLVEQNRKPKTKNNSSPWDCLSGVTMCDDLKWGCSSVLCTGVILFFVCGRVSMAFCSHCDGLVSGFPRGFLRIGGRGFPSCGFLRIGGLETVAWVAFLATD